LEGDIVIHFTGGEKIVLDRRTIKDSGSCKQDYAWECWFQTAKLSAELLA